MHVESMLTLNHSVDNPLLLWATTPSSQITWYRLVDLDESSLLIVDVEFVLIGQLVIAGTKLADRLIMLIHEGGVTMTMAVSGIVVSFEAEQDILALPTTGLEVGGPDAVDTIAGPYEVASIREDIWTCLTRTVLGRRRVCNAREWRYEQIALLDLVCCWDGDVQAWRSQISPRLVVPVCQSRWDCGGCGDGVEDAFHDADGQEHCRD